MRALWDTSLWIAASRNPGFTPPGDPDLDLLVTCGPVVQELLQGARPPFRGRLKDHLQAVPRVGDPVAMPTYIAAAEIYQRARDRGYEAIGQCLPLRQRNLRRLV